MRPAVKFVLFGAAVLAAADAASAAGPCDASAAAFAVGQAFSPALAEKARAAAGAERVRAIPPGLSVTMEFDPGRLTLVLDAARRVTRVSCG